MKEQGECGVPFESLRALSEVEGRSERRNGTAFNAEHAENAEKGRNRGKAEPRKEAASLWDAARQDSSFSAAVPCPP
jgi:hypothetical protein